MPKQLRSIPIGNRAPGLYSFPARELEPDFNGWELTLLVTPFAGKAFPFNDPALKIILRFRYSWDGGVTFPGAVAKGPIEGSPTGVWGAVGAIPGTDAPKFRAEIPFDSALGGRPTHYIAEGEIIGGTITVGVDVQEF